MPDESAMRVVAVGRPRTDEAADVLCDAFRDYPVMRHVIGDAGAAYMARLRAMVAFFSTARVLNGDPILGVEEAEGTLVAVANVSRPGHREPSPELAARREALWQQLGHDALERYETITAVWRTFAFEPSHYHLNSIGVRRSHQGRGAARLLLDAVHAMSASAPDSCGVSLTTEVAGNVPLYQHVGYIQIGHAVVPGAFETWARFRPDDVETVPGGPT
jgi:GNAT superfamily N-acetyltransferase